MREAERGEMYKEEEKWKRKSLSSLGRKKGCSEWKRVGSGGNKKGKLVSISE